MQEDQSVKLGTPVSLRRKISLPDLKKSSVLTGSGFENMLETHNTAVWTEANSPLVNDFKFIRDIKLRGSSFCTTRRNDLKLKIEFGSVLKRLSKTEEKVPTLTFRNTPRESVASSFRLRSPQLFASEPVKKPVGDSSSDLISETTVHHITFSEEDLMKSTRKVPSYLNLGEVPINRKSSHTSLARVAFIAKRPTDPSKAGSDSLTKWGIEKHEPSTANSSLLTVNRLPSSKKPQNSESLDTKASGTSKSFSRDLKQQDPQTKNQRSMIVPRLQEVIPNFDALMATNIIHDTHGVLGKVSKHSSKRYLLVKKEEGPLAKKMRNFRENT